MTPFLRARFLRFSLPAVAAAVLPALASAGVYTSPGGSIPDSPGNPVPGAPLIIPFLVTDVGPVQHIDLTLTGLSHTWSGDVIATLTSPTAVSADIMRRYGATVSTGTGDSSNFLGTYRFIDSGVDPVAIMTLAANTSAFNLPSADYWATTLGATATAGNKVVLDTVFGGAAALGTWTLSITDSAGLDTGSLTSATLNVVVAPEPTMLGAIGFAGLGILARRRRA